MIYWCLAASTQPIHVRITSEAPAEFPLCHRVKLSTSLCDNCTNATHEQTYMENHTNLYVEF